MVLLTDFYTHATHLCFSSIVEPAIIKDQLHVLHEVLNSRILVIFQLGFDGLEVHWIFYDHGVVGDFKVDIVDWLSEYLRLLIPL